MRIKAYAKVNLVLDVLRRLENGYHEVRMVMQSVDLADILTIEKNTRGIINITTNVEGLECDENNLIYKAAKRILAEAQTEQGFDIHLEKNIPIAAGMAGGSTDAAATLVGINRMLNLGFDVDKLKEIAVTIGADVPYCIEGGTQLSEGIGEKLTHLNGAPDCHILIAKPHIGVSTKYVYENLHVDRIIKHPDVDGMLKAIDNKDPRAVADKLDNILETVTAKEYPQIGRLEDIMKENGAMNAIMSGSGPTVFGLFEERSVAERALAAVEESGLAAQALVTGFANANCEEL